MQSHRLRGWLSVAAALLTVIGGSWLASPPASAQLPGELIVSITSPAQGATVSATAGVTASVTIVGLLVVRGVQFQVDGSSLGAEDTSAPYTVSWSTTTVANGPHTLTAIAHDTLGITYRSSPVTVTVSNGPPPDTTPPSVAITSPASGATVSGTIDVTADASDNVGVAGVVFFLDGAELGSYDTTSPYSVAWDTTATGNGSHSLTTEARDTAGNQTISAAVAVTVSNGSPSDTTPPSVSITSPASGATVSGTINVTANASDNVGVANVVFFLDGAELGEDATSPYAVSWDTTTAGNGSHTLAAEARDAAGNQGMSAAVMVTVSNGSPSDTTPPSVGITSPASGATVSGTINVTANASDNVGVAGVQFLLDGASIGAEDTTSPYAVSWDTTTAGNGSHSLTAVARDAAGNRTTSATVAVSVSNGSSSGPARSEETAATLAPSGAWSQIDNAGAGVTLSGGQAIYSGTTGATATFAFTGTGVTWIGFQCEICGTARVHLDGATVTTVDTYAPSRPASSGALYSVAGLASGNHTLVIEVTGGANPSSSGVYVDVDAFDVEGASGGGGGGTAQRVEETDPSVHYTGSWVPQYRSDLSGGSVVESNDPSATASLTFTGTSISWIGFKGPWAGIAQVYLDGALAATVDTYAPAEQSQAVVYTTAGLPSGQHTLKIQVTGTYDSSSASAWVLVDAFDVK